MLLYRGETRFDLKGITPIKLPILVNSHQIIIEVSCDRKPTTWNVAGTIQQYALVDRVGFCVLKSFPITFQKKNYDLYPQQSQLIFTPVKWLTRRTLISVYKSMAIYPLSGNPNPVASSGKNTVVSVLATVTTLVASDPSRLGMTLQNLGNKTVYVGFTNAVTATSYAIAIPALQAYEFPTVFTGALWAISASGTQSVNVIEMS